jgi:hypothetical protein
MRPLPVLKSIVIVADKGNESQSAQKNVRSVKRRT